MHVLPLLEEVLVVVVVVVVVVGVVVCMPFIVPLIKEVTKTPRVGWVLGMGWLLLFDCVDMI